MDIGIGDQGAEDLAETLRNNAVNYILSYYSLFEILFLNTDNGNTRPPIE